MWFALQPFSSLGPGGPQSDPALMLEQVDTTSPQEIVEEEELERISALLQRDNLVRGLGIVEHVYRLLHCTPGTMGLQLKNQHKYNIVGISKTSFTPMEARRHQGWLSREGSGFDDLCVGADR